MPGRGRRGSPGRVHRRFLVSLVVGIMAMASGVSAEPASVAIVGATIIDGTGRAPIRDAVIVIVGGRIAAVGPAATVPIPDGTTSINARGKYVVPGLMDANVHLLLDIEAEYLIKADGRYESLIAEAAQAALRNGLTTVFDTWGPREALINVRTAIERGELVGSRIFLAGNIVGFGGPMSADFVPAARDVVSRKLADEIDTAWEQGVGPELLWLPAEEVRSKVRAYATTRSIDFLKYASSGHTQEQTIAFSTEAQRAIVEEGQRAGLSVQAHTTSVESLRMALDAGADILQHCDVTGKVPIPGLLLDRMAREKVPCAALFRTDRHMAWVASQPQSFQRDRAEIKDVNDRNLIKAGVPILLSTDAGVYGENIESSPFASIVAGPDVLTVLGDGHFLWMQAAIERGMKPMDVLMAATRNIAAAYKVGHDLGTLEVGKRADLLVLDADPFQDVRNYRKIRMVMKDGVKLGR